MTPTLACPFCYFGPIRGRGDLWFLCSGQPTPYRPTCQPALDEHRQRLTGFSEPSLPAFPAPDEPMMLVPRQKVHCPSCGGETAIRACPFCHTRLPQEFGTSASPLIAMVGAKGTGKTVYLTVLAREVESATIGQEFGASVQPIGEGQDGDTSQAKWLRNNIREVYDEHRLFPATEPARAGRKEPLVLEWRAERARRFGKPRARTSYLSFYDTAGEDLASDAGTRSLRYLSAANCLILLLDPFQLPGAREQLRLSAKATPKLEPTKDVLARITATLKTSNHWNGRKITAPVAVAFTKMDAFYKSLGDTHPLRRRRRRPGGYDDQIGRIVHQEVGALLDGWGGSDINQYLKTYYRDYQYFFVSALGAEPNYGDARVDANGVHPDRVEEPLLWLMHESGLVEKVSP